VQKNNNTIEIPKVFICSCLSRIGSVKASILIPDFVLLIISRCLKLKLEDPREPGQQTLYSPATVTRPLHWITVMAGVCRR